MPLLLLLAGGVVGAAMRGFVKIPFLPFGKKKPVAKAPKDDGRGGPLAPYLTLAAAMARQAEAAPPPPTALATAKPDTGPGEAKLAALWAEMPAERLAGVIAKWPQAQLGRILALMDEDAVTALLAALPPERAANLSQTIAAATDENAAKVHTEGKK